MADVLIAIELAPDVAEKIRFMASSGVFNVPEGSVTLHFKEGKLRTIKRELYTYAPLDTSPDTHGKIVE